MSVDQWREALLEELTVAVIARNETANLPGFFDADLRTIRNRLHQRRL